MDGLIPDKAYFRIGEVSKILQVEPYVLRYWESEFKSIKPARTTSDQRIYRRKDVVELMMIKRLLYEEAFTIKGAKQYLAKMKIKNNIPDSSLALLSEIKEGLLQIKELIDRK